ncbi:MAG: YjbQ family protein [Nitrospirota bacterium]|nr:MAG: YjbQ family protein [Nitrospirota bacterium]
MIRYINVKSKSRTELVNITNLIQNELSESGVESGICYLYVPHTTAAVTINEGADPSVQRDVLATLNKLIPKDAGYAHLEGNSDAHIKSSAIGASDFVLVEDGKLVLGTWQSIYFCEFDGPRHRRLAVKIVEC